MSRKDAIADSVNITREWVDNGISYLLLAQKYKTCLSVIHYIIYSQLNPKKLALIRLIHLSRGGKGSRWQKGQIAWNKGIHFDAGGRSHETRFKPGQIRGSAAQRYKSVGSITIRRDKIKHRGKGRARINSYQWIKIKDTGPPRYCWIQYARFVYEKAYGPIPHGFFPIHKDNDTLNDEPSNLVLVERAGNVRRNGHSPESRLIASKHRIETCRQRRSIKALLKDGLPKSYRRFECPECGWSCDAKQPPDRCPKCGNGSLELLRQKVA